MTTTYDAPIPYNSNLSYDGLPPIVTSEDVPTFGLFATHRDGDFGPLPEVAVEQMSFEASAPSAISFTMLPGMKGYDLLDDLTVVELRMNGIPVKDGRWLLRLGNWNEAVQGKPKQFGGRHLLWDRLSKTTIWNDKRYLYSGKTVGFVLNDIFQIAKNRGVGYWPNFTWTFDQAKDSAGNAWPETVEIEYLPTAKYDAIVANLVDKGLIDISLRGNEIYVTTSGKSGRTTDSTLVVGEDVTDAPQASSADNLVSHVLMIGDEGITVVRQNNTTATTYWREEDGISQGGTKDIGTLSIIGDVALSNGDSPRIQRTYGIVMNHLRRWLPIRDYEVQDWVGVEHGGGFGRYRVKQIAFKQENGYWTGSLVLNDKFLENELRLAKKVEGIIGGATIAGSSQVATPGDLRDTSKPLAPTGLTLSFQQYQDNEGKTNVSMIADWNDVTQNTDGSVANDIDLYRFVWRYADEPASRPSRWVFTPESRAVVSGMDLNRDVVAYTYVWDSSGNSSVVSPSVNANTGGDQIAPAATSVAGLISRLKVLTIAWDGLDLNGLPMAGDFKEAIAYISRINNFDPLQDGQPVGTLTRKGELAVSMYGYSIGETVYVRLVAVDNSGNRSAPSGVSSNSIWGVFQGDLAANAVTANVIAAGAVGTQHMLAAAIDAGRLSLGPTMNLVQDPSFNNAEMRARRLTTAWADRPSFWTFKGPGDLNWSLYARSGYYLQMLSTPAGENGGRMYVTDWISSQFGETYYFGVYARQGEFTPSVTARLFLGIEVTKSDGSVVTDGLSLQTFTGWQKYGFNMPVGDATWTKLRFFVRADDLNAGDIIMDDWEVRSAVGTTASAGPRGVLTPEGLETHNASEAQTFLLDFSTGDLFARGQIVSGSLGKRIEINPGETFLPEIRFYPDEGERYAYINAVAGGTGDIPYLGLNGPDIPGTPIKGDALILWDAGFLLGELDKDTGAMYGGPGMQGEVGLDSHLYIHGKIPWSIANTLMFQGFRTQATVGTPGSGVVIGKPPAAVAGSEYFPYYSVWAQQVAARNHHISSNTATTVTVQITTGAAATNHVFYMFFARVDS